MKILIVGGGGREHALAWKISKSPEVTAIFCAPGNAGISEMAERVDIDANDIVALKNFALENSIDLTVIGPEGPLVSGIVDVFEKEGLKVFGPNRSAAQIEGSKSFAKQLMLKYNIPTAAGRTFNDYEHAVLHLEHIAFPCVIKADGLAAGKGVVVCSTREEAGEALDRIMNQQVFGESGATVLIEEFLAGEEASFIAFTDGKTVLPLPASQDHKAIFADDKGPNTGGMGAVSPAPVVDMVMRRKIMEQVMLPAVKAMAAEKCPYKGVLYAGLMIHNDKVKVVEFNCRFGDPETQPILMRTRNDIVPLMNACITGGLENYAIDIDERAAACVVMAAKGYPDKYDRGIEIQGLGDLPKADDRVVFHSGTAEKQGKVVTAGGRVLGVTAMGETMAQAVSKAYETISAISFEGEYHRPDIGRRAIDRLQTPPTVGIVMGSDSDFSVMAAAAETLLQFGISYQMLVCSAHRTPEEAAVFARGARDRGMKIIIAGAGHAAHLAGAMAAHSSLPIIGVPIDSSALSGFDALLATVQMPPGIPVATMAVGKPGAKNAAVFAAQILSTHDSAMAKKVDDYKRKMAAEVIRKAKSFAG
jgi:phosphoribosylamine---glycine ligase